MGQDQCVGLLRKIQEMEFVAIELQLFIDTHPHDQTAIADYNRAIDILKRLMDEYEVKYGSLSMLGKHGTTEWGWVEDPWPWEICY